MLPELESLKNVITNSRKFSLLACKSGTHKHVRAFSPVLRFRSCLQSPLAEQPWTRSRCPASLGAEADPPSAINGACALHKQRNAYQIANGAENKHSF